MKYLGTSLNKRSNLDALTLPSMSSDRRFASDDSGSAFVSHRLSPTSFRSLVWRGSVPVSVSLDEAELGSKGDRLVDCYYVCYRKFACLRRRAKKEAP